jgi:vacuolar protein sorting-associated protein IST1
MPPSTWNAAKAKVQLRLSVQRLRIAQQKKEAHAKGSRRDIALLLEKGKIESARVKVEAVINEDVNLELYELLELYCELLIARFGLLDQNTRDPDAGISEGVCSIIHAAPRTEVKELLVLRDMLMHKYGREFSAAAMENRSGCVSERIMRKLVIETPSEKLVDAYLGEIANAYSVKLASASRSITAAAQGSVVDGPSGSDTLESLPLYSREISDKLPDIPPTEDETEKPKASVGGKSHQMDHSKEETEDEFAVLARRFEELKKR